MWSLSSSSSFHLALVPPWKYNTNLLYKESLKNTKLYTSSPRNLTVNSSSNEDSNSSSTHKQNKQVGFDTSEEFFGLDVDIPPRDAKPDNPEPRSWFGPNGQYIKELPCPSCRGRGYTPCTECGIERSRKDCSLCHGKGMMTCQRCLGECVIWEELIDEKPWEKARSISPLKVKEDDEVDNLDLELDVRKKSKRVYRSTPPEVGQKISRSLKSLNAKTGLFSKRMKIIHQDPALHAQRVAAVKKAKRTTAARKRASEALKMYFSNPENRRKRSIAVTGKKYICKNCGREGHRSYYCPEQQESVDRRSKCGLCGERGHNRLTCQKTMATKPKQRVLRPYHCRACGQVGHNRRTCSLKSEQESVGALTGSGISHLEDSSGQVQKHYHCRVCGHSGHNRRTCPQLTMRHVDVNAEKRPRQPYHCRKCGIVGHNRRTCSEATLIK